MLPAAQPTPLTNSQVSNLCPVLEPHRVEYTLTGIGRSLIEPITVIADWAEVNVGRTTAAQATYDTVPQR